MALSAAATIKRVNMAIEQLIQAVLTASPAKRRELEDVLKGKAARFAKGENLETRLVTISGAARLMALGRNTVYKLIRSKRLDTVDLNGCPRITMKSIKEFLEGERPANTLTDELVAESKARYAESKGKGDL